MHGRQFLRKASLAVLVMGVAAACGDTQTIIVPDDPAQVDRFPQAKASAIDILFVIDNSGSMARSQSTLAGNFEHFLKLIDPDPTRTGEPGEVDYRLAVATTDTVKEKGVLRANSGEPKVLRRDGGYDPLAIFRERVVVGTKGAAREEGLRAAELALEAAGKIEDAPKVPAFLRPGAYLYVIFVSDEDDDSRDEVRYFERNLRSLKGIGNEGTVIVSAIAGPIASTLPAVCIEKGSALAAPGHRYWELVQKTNGSFGNICLPDWADTLEELAFTGLGLRKRFQLTKLGRVSHKDGVIDMDYLFESVEVHYPCTLMDDDPYLSPDVCATVTRKCGGEDPRVVCVPMWDPQEENGFWFEERDNTLVFGGDSIPGPGSTIVVRYLPRAQ